MIRSLLPHRVDRMVPPSLYLGAQNDIARPDGGGVDDVLPDNMLQGIVGRIRGAVEPVVESTVQARGPSFGWRVSLAGRFANRSTGIVWLSRHPAAIS